jgi:cephalosporin hydroxylase
MLDSLKKFHIHYEEERLWEKTSWLGVPAWKLPFDAWIIQELIYKVKPDYIIETGTGHGGSALFYASICELLGKGKVITIDIEDKRSAYCEDTQEIADKRIIFLLGSSIDSITISSIYYTLHPDAKVMVLLDSWHTKDHVLAEMILYSPLVSIGSYLIVEDTHVNGNPVPWDYGEGPMEAVKEFLSNEDDFVIDKDCEKLMFTFNPNGYLRRVR